MNATKLQIQDTNGDIIDERNMILSNNDILVITVDTNDTHFGTAEMDGVLETMLDKLAKGGPVVVPSMCKFSVIKTEKVSDNFYGRNTLHYPPNIGQ